MNSGNSALPMIDSPSTTKLPLRTEKADAAPICVDLDGTLVRSDTLIELLLKASRSQPWLLVLCLFWIMKGKAYLKEKIAEHVTISPELLPYNSELVSYLKAQKATGRKVLLVTASHRSWAEKIADHVGIFDDVIATDGSINLRGANKANILCQRFGEGLTPMQAMMRMTFKFGDRRNRQLSWKHHGVSLGAYLSRSRPR